MTTFNWIDNPQALTNLITQLQTQAVIAVDTESNSLYSYFETVCLVQLSTLDADYIIDPLAVDISPLGSVFASAAVEKIFHAAEYDVMSLKRDYGFQFARLFDTMLAAKILGWPQCGLGNVLKTHFRVKVNKKFQQYNWGRRPLVKEALQYARLDTHYLARLRTRQLQELQTQGRVDEARAAFDRICSAKTAPKLFNPGDFRRIKGAKTLAPAQQAALQALFVFRDERARHANRPPFKVVQDSVLIQLVQHPPRSVAELKQVKGINSAVADRHGRKILSLLRATHPAPAPPERRARSHRFDEAALLRDAHLRSWRNELAHHRGVEPAVILSNGVLRAIARANPAGLSQLKAQNILGRWQFKTYATEIVKTLKRCPH
ncbi:MAG: ribonuclease D [Anaerolineae bacterium]